MTQDILTSEILAAIQKNLPEAQSQAIRDSLNELAELRTTNKKLQDRATSLSKDFEDAERAEANAVRDLTEMRIEHDRVTELLHTAEAEPREAQVVRARAELASVERTVDKFLRNTTTREAVQRTVIAENPGTIQYGNNGSITGVPGSKYPVPVTDVTTSTTDPEEN